MAIFLTLAGLAIGSFLNVCIDRLPPRRFLHLAWGKDSRLDIEVSNKAFIDEPEELFKDKEVVVTGKIIKSKTSRNYQISVIDGSQIKLKEETGEGLETISPTEGPAKDGQTVTIAGRVTETSVIKNSLSSPPSHCDSCGQRLSITDNIPIFSYLFLRGKCRYCGARIPGRVLLVELLTAAVFLAGFLRLGFTVQYAITVFWSCIFILIIFIDWEQTLILDKITLPCMAIAVALLAVNSFVPGVNFYGERLFIPGNGLYSGLISGGVLFVIFLLIIIITRSMGMGDAKLVALIGLTSGFPLVVFSMLIGIVVGGVFAIYLLATRKKGRKDVIPYGTFLAIGPIIAMLLPVNAMDWYLSLGR